MTWKHIARELIATAGVILFVLAVWKMGAFDWANPSQYVARLVREQALEFERDPRRMTAENHLPTRCRAYYADGTDRWIECMGVGRR